MRFARSWFVFGLALLTLTPERATSQAKLTLRLEGMSPHVGQKFEARLVNKGSRNEVGRVKVDPIANENFDVEFEDAIEVGDSYWIDFYADFNGNGLYDAPPTDHTWRMELNDAQGDTILTFTHNTNFTDIGWVYLLTLNLTGMTPHVGQKFEARAVDLGSAAEIGRVTLAAIGTADFTVEIPGLEIGRSYRVDFYADFNQNGLYDSPPDDHTWRMTIDNAAGDATLDFTHNTDFTEIDWVYLFTLELQNMNPHVGQKFEVRVIDLSTMGEVGRASIDSIVVPDFSVSVPGVLPGREYQVDYYADLSQNGLYDAPPTDHAWRDVFNNTTGDAVLSFTHNTNFTDVDWVYLFTLELKNMNPHLGQLFELRVVDQSDDSEVGRTRREGIPVPDFSVWVPGLRVGKEYRVDYYADLNQSGTYDPPPTDHAWRDTFVDEGGDITRTFEHNTNFTDIGWPPATTVEERSGDDALPTEYAIHANFPNPFNPETQIRFDLPEPGQVRVEVFNTLGHRVRVLVDGTLTAGRYTTVWDGRDDLGRPQSSGVYFYRLQTADFSRVRRMLLLK